MPVYTKETFIAMQKAAVALIEENHEDLSKLDAATGDGDHGVTMQRAMQAVGVALDEAADKSLVDLIKAVAMKVMMTDGGSVSPLLGSWFMGMASAVSSDELSAADTANMFDAALAGFYGISKAELGDKTMMDALRPATETLSAELNGGADFNAAFSAAATAAEEGREKTKDYVAKFGRARTMGDRAIGHYDAGATSIALIFKGFASATI